ncbi:class I SAM-dependent methyltransferase [Solicola sp. PLA-1-18]|uniref:class I SAM-dependent methyltransferase n=1 Tax=Solicola sp. PLA-1-18 TaxID=3380532 RepID=UPI003B80FE7F
MTRWDDVGVRVDAGEYASRFAEAEASGQDVHGEAALCHALLGSPGRVLDAGCGHGRVAIRLASLGHDVVGVDAAPDMVALARTLSSAVRWVDGDLASLSDLGLGGPFDLVVAAGNVVPLLAAGTEAQAVRQMASVLRPGGLLLAGFGLDPDHLPLDEAPFGLDAYARWCADAGLVPAERWAGWAREPWDGGGYAVSLHARPGEE